MSGYWRLWMGVSVIGVLAVCRLAPGEEASRRKMRVVVMGAHCDDPETGAGGLIAALTRGGHEVICVYGTTFRGGRMINGQPEDVVRRKESSEACKVLGASTKFFAYAHEHLWAVPEVIEEVRHWLESVKPDVVVAQWPFDTHPNHHAIASLAWQAYKREGEWNLYFYEVCTGVQSLGFRPELYLDIEPVIDVKKKAIDCIVSQNPKELWDIHSKMQSQRGQECGRKYAEAYFLVEEKKGCPLLPITFLPKR